MCNYTIRAIFQRSINRNVLLTDTVSKLWGSNVCIYLSIIYL